MSSRLEILNQELVLARKNLDELREERKTIELETISILSLVLAIRREINLIEKENKNEHNA